MNGISVLLRAMISVVVSKIVAIYIGPQGMALLGNFRNFINSVQTLGGLGLSNGIIKYVSESKSDSLVLEKLYATLFFLGGITSILVGGVIYFGAGYWNSYVFGERLNLELLFKFLGIVLPFYVAQIFLLNVINGLSKYKTYVYINIIGNSLYFITVVFLIVRFKLVGALYGIVLTPVLLFLVTVLFLWKEKFRFTIPEIKNLSSEHVRNLAIFAVMTMFSGLLLPQVLMQIRIHLITNIGEIEAGIWEGLQQFSSQYLLFVTSLFTLYLLPKLSENLSDLDFRKEVLIFYRSILPFLALGMVLIYFLRKYIVIFLFSKDFLEMESLFAYQLIGDFLKIMSLTLAYQLIAKKMFWKYLLTEAISIGVIYGTSVYFIDAFGFEGVVQAYALSYLLYLLLLVGVFRKSLFFTK